MPIGFVAKALGVEVSETVEVYERWATPSAIDFERGRVEAGCAAAHRIKLSGVVDGEERIVIDHIHRVVPDVAPDWPRPASDPAHANRVVIKGSPNIAQETVLADEFTGDGNAGGCLATGMRAVNALPAVVAGLTRAPVIAVPTSVGYGAAFEGLAPLLTMMNACAPGVAVVNIDNGFGAAALALKMLGVNSFTRKQQPQSGEPKKQQPPRARDQTGRAETALAAAESVGDDVLDETAAAAAPETVEDAADGATSEPAGAAAESPPPSELSESTDADEVAAGEEERQRDLLQRWRAKEEHA